jgi:exodeoxyribonuclease VIII
MVDLETLGTGPDAVILSIGAAKFDPTVEGDPILDTFHQHVDPANAQAVGMKITASTVMWWLHPDRAAARDELLKYERVDLWSVLYGFKQWFGDESLPLWGNGATFDNVILRTAYEKVNEPAPWEFWHDRCYRTMKSFATSIPLVREGVHHDAKHDAISQAKHLVEIMRAMNVSLKGD